jgi:hypothetical protein
LSGFAVSRAGPVTCGAGGGASRHLTWIGPTGKTLDVSGEPDAKYAAVARAFARR